MESWRTLIQAVTVDGKFLPVVVGFQGLGLGHGQAYLQETGKGDP